MSDSRDQSLDRGQLQTIIDSSTDCIKVLDLDAHLLSMNAGGMDTMEVTDFSSCQFLLWPSFWEGEARLQVEQAIQAAREGKTSTFEGPARTVAGTPKWWEVRVSPLRDADGAITQLLAISRDVTTRKTAEQRLQASELRLQARADTLEVQVSENERALDAFVRFTTQVASSTDLTVLATAALDILRDVVGNATSGFYLTRGDTAYPLVFSSNTPPEVRALRHKGIPLRAPLITEALRVRGVAFAERDQGRQQSVGYATALSVTPYFHLGQPYALLASGTERPVWTEQERAVIQSVGQGLGLALERSHQTQQLQERTAGLDAFVAFAERAATTIDLPQLAHYAVDVLRATLGAVSVAYYTQERALWKAQVWSDDFAPEVAAGLAAGISVTAPSYAQAVQTRQPVFVPGWQAEDEAVAGTDSFGAGAFYPCFVDGVSLGLLAMGTQRAGDWTPREQAVFNAVGRSLTLALERSEHARLLTQQRDVLERKSQELSAANAELEAFAYSASHDLRTPVRHVMGFAQLAQRALVEQPNNKAYQHLEVVKQGALRMTALIDGMLALSSAGRQPLAAQLTDLGELTRQAQRDVASEFAGQRVDWQIDGLPHVWGDPGMLQQVMTNLLSNAVKYSSTRERSAVRIWAQEGEDEWTVSIQDNGVGFDPNYAQKLFGIFQRLHSEREFQGTGVGLATVRRIILKHGGRVSAESSEQGGATFSFALPKQR
jgi:PAS domain S-box-containing protein